MSSSEQLSGFVGLEGYTGEAPNEKVKSIFDKILDFHKTDNKLY